METVKATEQHFPVIQEIARITWYHTYSELLSPGQSEYMLEMMYSTEALKEQIYHKSHRYLLVKDGGEFIGYISYELNYENSGKTKVQKIYVLPRYHGKGVGKLLIDEVEKIAKANSSCYLLLNMNKNNTAVHFYKKMGFRIVAEDCIDIGQGYVMDDYILEKEI